MILNYDQIKEAVEKKEIEISPFEEGQIQAATYDLRIGKHGATTSQKKLVDLEEEAYLSLQPGDFAIIVTLEELRLSPRHAARFGLRSKYARKGLIATTGPPD